MADVLYTIAAEDVKTEKTCACVVQNEYANAFDAESAAFNEALEWFCGYYAHEPIVIYFDTAQDIPMAGEESKIVNVLDDLNRYPDVRLEIAGFADERGPEGYNFRLSLRRARSANKILNFFFKVFS